MPLVENLEQTLTANPLDALKSAAGTDVGRKRDENQDSFGIIEREDSKIFIVADGMGGAKGGAVASKLSIETVKKSLEHVKKVTVDILAEAILEANDVIFQRSIEDPGLSGMGTTIVAYLFTGTSLHFLHVGDSRAYRVRRGKIDKLTEDHTLVAELVRAGAITEEQAEHHPVSHMLTRSLGPSSEVVVDKKILSDGPIRGDKYLLCSDGLYNMLADKDIGKIIEHGTLDEAIEKLLFEANENGGTDNITALLIEIGESFPVGIEDITSDLSALYEKEKQREKEDRVSPSASIDHVSMDGEDFDFDPNELGEDSDAYQELSAQQARVLKLKVFARRGSLAAFFLLLGMIVGPVLLSSKQEPKAAVTVEKTALLAPIAIESEIKVPQYKQAKLSTILYESTPELIEGIKAEKSELQLSKDERDNIEKRKRALGDKIALLDERLAYFKNSSSAQIEDVLNKDIASIDAITAPISKLKDKVDVASRMLSVWFGRKKRMDVDDTLALATEVAVTIPEIKTKKDEFESVTWEYLKASEEFRSTPENKDLEMKTSDLSALRKEKLKQLTASLREAIDRTISAADKQMSDITIEKQVLEDQLKSKKNKTEFLKVLAGSSESSRGQLRISLETEKQAVVKEYAELASIAGQ